MAIQRSWLRLYGVTDRGEILLRGERDFAPFDEARVVMALERLQSARQGNQKLEDALRKFDAVVRPPGSPRQSRETAPPRVAPVRSALGVAAGFRRPPSAPGTNPGRAGDPGRRRGRPTIVESWRRYCFTPETAEHLALVRVAGYGLLFLIYLPLDDRGCLRRPSDWSRAASMLTAVALGFFLLGLPNCFRKIHRLDGFPVLLLTILALSRCPVGRPGLAAQSGNADRSLLAV